MDERTEQLRDLFVEVTDEETVTESQRESPGSLLSGDEATDRQRVRSIVEAMAERYEFVADLPVERRIRLVEAYYDEEDDPAIADELDVPVSTVVDARLDMHLRRESDLSVPVAEAIREHSDESAVPVEDLAAELDVDPATIERYRRAVAIGDRIRRANERYQDAFDDVLGDGDIAARLAESAREDGLREATEDIETDVKF